MKIEIENELHGINFTKSACTNETFWIDLNFQGLELNLLLDMEELKHLKEKLNEVI